MIDMPSEIILRAVLDVLSFWTYKCVSYAFIRQQAHINKEHDLIITLLSYCPIKIQGSLFKITSRTSAASSWSWHSQQDTDSSASDMGFLTPKTDP